ncbi:hypothetical protein SRHO_G00000290 [Serrasalmus rhombeus]
MFDGRWLAHRESPGEPLFLPVPGQPRCHGNRSPLRRCVRAPREHRGDCRFRRLAFPPPPHPSARRTTRNLNGEISDPDLGRVFSRAGFSRVGAPPAALLRVSARGKVQLSISAGAAVPLRRRGEGGK